MPDDAEELPVGNRQGNAVQRGIGQRAARQVGMVELFD
jgi:hypothetical protein